MGFSDFIKRGWQENQRQRAGKNEGIKSPGLLSVFKALSTCDFITPAIGIAETVYNDPTPLQTNSWTFFVPYDHSLKSGFNAMDIDRLMDQHGIHTWGKQVTNGEYFFSCDIDQAQWAEYLLLKNNVPINGRFIGAPPPRQGR